MPLLLARDTSPSTSNRSSTPSQGYPSFASQINITAFAISQRSLASRLPCGLIHHFLSHFKVFECTSFCLAGRDHCLPCLQASAPHQTLGAFCIQDSVIPPHNSAAVVCPPTSAAAATAAATRSSRGRGDPCNGVCCSSHEAPDQDGQKQQRGSARGGR